MNWSCPCCKAEFEVELKPLAVLEPVRKAPKKVVVPLAQYGEYGKIRMKESEYDILLEEYGEFLLQKAIKGMENWMIAKNKKGYTSYRAALQNWIQKDLDSNPYLKEKLPVAHKEAKEKKAFNASDWE